jgi:isoleucyl-tRNA synthetase
LWHLAEALCRWIAPILSFTAEEIWENLPGAHAESVFLVEWYQALPSHSDSASDALWSAMLNVRQAVNKAMEAKRAAGELKGGLDAEVALYADGDLFEQINSLGDELRFVLISSAASVQPWPARPEAVEPSELPGLAVQVTVSAHEKCERCWHRRPDVGTHAEHPTLCGRCISNIEGPGEQRRYA